MTGTNGKTSTVDFLRQMLCLAGRRAASLGTLGVIAEGVPATESLTTPDPVTLANTLAMLARRGRHAMRRWRRRPTGSSSAGWMGCSFAAAGFTNLTRDHLDYHGAMEAYRAAKLRLFDRLLPRGAPARGDGGYGRGDACGSLREIAVRRGLDLRLVQRGADRAAAGRAGGEVISAGGSA